MFRVVAIVIAAGLLGLTSFAKAESPSENSQMADFVGRYAAYKEVCVLDPLTPAEHIALDRIAAGFGYRPDNADPKPLAASRKWHYMSHWEGVAVYTGCAETMELLRGFAKR